MIHPTNPHIDKSENIALVPQELFNCSPIVGISALSSWCKSRVFNYLQLERQLPLSFTMCDFDEGITC